MMNRNIRVVPCTVNMRLKVVASAMIWDPGRKSSALIARASAPPRKRNPSDVIRYKSPMSVWCVENIICQIGRGFWSSSTILLGTPA